MKKNVPYPRIDEEDDNFLIAQEPVAAYAVEAVSTPDNLSYAHIVDGVLQVTADIEDEIAAADRGETVTLDEFKTLFARWIEK